MYFYSMKTTKIIYYVGTGLLSFLLLASAGMYLFNTSEVAKLFLSFGYPTYLVYPLAFAKITAVIVLWTKLKTLKEWTYSALTFEFILAFFAHYMIKDGEQFGALIALVLLGVSYIFGKKLSN